MQPLIPRERLPQNTFTRLLLALSVAGMIVLAAGGLTEEKPNAPQDGSVRIDCDAINESSGVALSSRDPHVIWTHNDSGDRPRLFAVNRIGKLVGELNIKNAKAVDWEDICSFQKNGMNWLVIGDCGDNDRKRDEIVIYIVEEPRLEYSDEPSSAKVDREIHVRYPTGPVDCEAIAYDPLSSSVWLCTKETFRTRLFQVSVPDEKGRHDQTAKHQGTLALPWVTGADISRDGNRFVIATYGPAGLLSRKSIASQEWTFNANDAKLYRTLELPARHQGESVCFESDGNGLILTSEADPTPLLFVPIPPAE